MDATTIPHITPFRELPTAAPKASGFAGQGNRLDVERKAPLLWDRQCVRWGLRPPQDPHQERRLWRVVMRPGENSGRTKVERVLPSGRVIRIFEDDGLAASFLTLVERRKDGPLYELPFADAAALWRDRFVQVTPACETFVLEATG